VRRLAWFPLRWQSRIVRHVLPQQQHPLYDPPVEQGFANQPFGLVAT